MVGFTCLAYTSTDLDMVVRSYPSRGQRREFAYLFQLAHVAMQMDVHKTLYCFYTQ